VKHVRQAVRFVDGARELEAQGVRVCVELGPHGVLSSMAAGCVSEAVALLPALRRDRPEAETLALALGGLHCHGVRVDWQRYFEPFAARRVELPTYGFQRERYWLEASKSKATDVASAGLEATEHPLLGAAVALADSDGFVFTARLSLADHPWLRDHVVFEHVLFPGTGFLDLALTAGAHVGAPRVEEISIAAPLVLGTSDVVTLQLSVGQPDGGRRSFSLHSRYMGNADGPWTLHASGTLGTQGSVREFEWSAWPPRGATAVDLEGIHERLSESGLAYGPAFQGLSRAWKDGDTRFAEVHLSEGLDVDGFAIHPALLDAALHVLAVDAGSILLPFAWSGVDLLATGASTLRVRLRPIASEGSFELEVADVVGQPIASVGTLAVRPATAAAIQAALGGSQPRHLYEVNWRPIPLGKPNFDVVVQLGGEPIGTTKVVENIADV
jgi:acyl transferase domain-containing protein